MFKRIAVGGDEHEGSLDAIAQAKNLLDGDGELTGVRPAHGGHGYRGPGAAYEASGWERAAQLLERVREQPTSTRTYVGGWPLLWGADCTGFAR